jgi:hypothetical protein
MIFKYAGRIVHGSHPAFTPIILRQARQQATERNRKPVTLVMSELWAKDRSAEDLESLTDVAELVITKKMGHSDASDPDTRNRSLTAMRRVLIDSRLSLEMEVSMQILKMVAYAAGGSVVVGLLLGGVLELVRAVQMHTVQTRKP